ncbi:MAG: DsbA family protein [Actinomycetota bacterium]|nr:DsbA family protein [Actinomycetota bacterium]
MIDVPPGRVVVFADIACPWAHVAVHRLHETRARLGLGGRVVFDMHAFALEIVNRRPTPKNILDVEIPVAGALEPEAGWQVWQRPDHEYPGTTLPALEAVHAAKEQGLEVAEALDRALRRALFGASCNVSMRHEILEVAATVPGLDAAALARAVDDGRARSLLSADRALAERDEVAGSPHVFLPDGEDVHNPGIEMHWEGEHGEGFPVVDRDDPAVYERLLEAAATRAATRGDR